METIGTAVKSMFSGAGITSGYTTSYFGTATKPLVVTRFPPSRLSATRAQLLQRQQVQTNQFDIGYYLATGVKVPPAKVVVQSNQKTTYNGSIVDGNGGSTCLGSGCQ
jgi:hypothetical protein